MQIHADPDPNHCIHLRHTWDASRVAEPELGFLVWSLLTHEANEETISSQGLAPEPKDFKKLGSHPQRSGSVTQEDHREMLEDAGFEPGTSITILLYFIFFRLYL